MVASPMMMCLPILAVWIVLLLLDFTFSPERTRRALIDQGRFREKKT
jgi:uncharacterized membrane protein YqiK